MARQLELRFEVFKGTNVLRPDPDPDPELRFEVFKGTNMFKSDPDPDLHKRDLFTNPFRHGSWNRTTTLSVNIITVSPTSPTAE
jgi:hypothetical protein